MEATNTLGGTHKRRQTTTKRLYSSLHSKTFGCSDHLNFHQAERVICITFMTSSKFKVLEAMTSLLGHLGADLRHRLALLSVPVTTVESLLGHDTVKLANELHISIKELDVLKLQVSRKMLFPGGTSQVGQDSATISWQSLTSALPTPLTPASGVRPLGIPVLEALLGGGLPPGSITNIIGGTGAGKTFIATSCSAACGLLGLKVLVISASNDMSLRRLQSTIENIMRVNQNPSKPYTASQAQELIYFALSNVHMQHCYDLWSLLDLLSNVKDHNTYDVIAIDSLHHFVAPLCLTTSSSSTLTRGTTVSGMTNSTAGTISPAVASEFATSLLSQVGVLLRSFCAQHTSVLLTNTPALSTGLARRNSTNITRTASTTGYNTHSNTSSYPPNSAYKNNNNISTNFNNTIETTGNGTSSAFLDLVDITISLEKAEYDRSQSIRELFNQSSAAVAAAAGNCGTLPVPTVIRAGIIVFVCFSLYDIILEWLYLMIIIMTYRC